MKTIVTALITLAASAALAQTPTAPATGANHAAPPHGDKAAAHTPCAEQKDAKGATLTGKALADCEAKAKAKH